MAVLRALKISRCLQATVSICIGLLESRANFAELVTNQQRYATTLAWNALLDASVQEAIEGC